MTVSSASDLDVCVGAKTYQSAHEAHLSVGFDVAPSKRAWEALPEIKVTGMHSEVQMVRSNALE